MSIFNQDVNQLDLEVELDSFEESDEFYYVLTAVRRTAEMLDIFDMKYLLTQHLGSIKKLLKEESISITPHQIYLFSKSNNIDLPEEHFRSRKKAYSI